MQNVCACVCLFLLQTSMYNRIFKKILINSSYPRITHKIVLNIIIITTGTFKVINIHENHNNQSYIVFRTPKEPFCKLLSLNVSVILDK